MGKREEGIMRGWRMRRISCERLSLRTTESGMHGYEQSVRNFVNCYECLCYQLPSDRPRSGMLQVTEFPEMNKMILQNHAFPCFLVKEIDVSPSFIRQNAIPPFA